MKKWLVLPFIAISFLVSGCDSQRANDKGSSDTFTETKASETKVSKETSKTKSSVALKELEKIESSEKIQLNGLEEAPKLEEILAGVTGLNIQVLNDQGNKRVLLLFNTGKTKKYKSIFLKNTRRLKVIDEISGDLVFNSTI